MATQHESVEYRFTSDELRELGMELGRANQTIYDLRSDKASVVTSMGAAIKAAEKHAAELTTKLNQKFEMRDTEVIAVMDRPRSGLKTLVRVDTGEELRIVAMTLEEQQSTFSFGDGEGPRPEK
jgi:hypothetical protein